MNHNLPEISINWHKRREKKSSLTKVWQVRLLAKPVLKTDIQICQTVYCILRHSGCLHLSNTPLRARWKAEPLKLHNGLWCRVYAPYGYVPLSHLGNIVLTNEIHVARVVLVPQTECATLVISVFFLLQKRMKNVLLIQNNSAFIYLFNMLPKRSYICILKWLIITKQSVKTLKSLTYRRIYRSYRALSLYWMKLKLSRMYLS